MNALIVFVCATAIASAAPGKGAAALTERIQAVCPIHGVSIGKASDKATWRIDFAPEAEDGQKVAAWEVIQKWTVADWDGTPEERRAAQVAKIEDLLITRQRCLLWQENDILRRLMDRQKEIDDITAKIAELVQVLK